MGDVAVRRSPASFRSEWNRTMMYLVMHGETEFNVTNRIQGWKDSSLTLRGREQARLHGMHLNEIARKHPIKITASPLGRAQSTAHIIAEQIDPTPDVECDPRLKEVGLGGWEGLTEFEIDNEWPGATDGSQWFDWYFHSPNGEDLQDVVARLEDFLADQCTRLGPRIIVSHTISGRILRGLYSKIPIKDALQLGVSRTTIYQFSNGQISEINNQVIIG